MKRNGKTLELSATDLVGYLNCGHLSNLDRAVADGALAKPHVWKDPLLEVLWERGTVHEQNYVEHLKSLGLAACRTELFHILGIVENGRFRLPWRFDLAALAPVDPATGRYL